MEPRLRIVRGKGRATVLDLGRFVVASTPLRPDRREQCPKREGLLREWTDCSNRLMRLQGEEFAAMRVTGSAPASSAMKIGIAKGADVEASGAYHQHVNTHGCV